MSDFLLEGMARTKALELMTRGAELHGLALRKGRRITLVTTHGRVESYPANEHGGIDLDAAKRERDNPAAWPFPTR